MLKKRNSNIVLGLYWRYIVLLGAVALQNIVIYIQIYRQQSLSIEALTILLLTTLVIPIGYLFHRMVIIFLAVVWASIYTAWLLTFFESASFVAYSLIFTIPILLIIASNARRQNQIVNSAYLKYLNRKVNQSLFIDEFTGLPNFNSFEKHCKIDDYKNQVFYLFGLKFTFYDQIIDRIGTVKYIEMLDEFVDEFQARYFQINLVYSISSRFYMLRAPNMTEEEVNLLSDAVKEYFQTTDNISVQTGFISSTELMKRGVDTPEEAVKTVQDIVEVDLNAEYF